MVSLQNRAARHETVASRLHFTAITRIGCPDRDDCSANQNDGYDRKDFHSIIFSPEPVDLSARCPQSIVSKGSPLPMTCFNLITFPVKAWRERSPCPSRLRGSRGSPFSDPCRASCRR